MNKILFPFEPQNPIYREAYIYAVKFARNLDAELILLNTFAIDDYYDDITSNIYKQKIKQKWLQAYEEVILLNEYYLHNHARFESDLRIKFDHRFIHGTLVNEVKQILKNEEIDLLVLPVSDKEEENKRMLSIISDEIFEQNNTSLLITPFNKPFEVINNIVFATDLKKLNHSKLYLSDIKKYANIFDAKIHFLHISKSKSVTLPDDIEAYRLIMDFLKKEKEHSFETIYSENIGDGLKAYLSNNKINLLTVVKHKHYFLENLFHKSLSKQISLKSKIPTLVMREKKD